jgi:hypothetical protein
MHSFVPELPVPHTVIPKARHCERSEAIQSFLAALDCFAALAMT